MCLQFGNDRSITHTTIAYTMDLAETRLIKKKKRNENFFGT